MTLGGYLDEWLESVRSGLRPGSFDTSSIHVNAYIKPRLGSGRLQALSRRAVRSFYADLASSGRIRGEGGLGDKTIHNIHRTLSKALDDAVEDGLLNRNPARGAHKLPESPEQESWTAEEVRGFLELHADDRQFPLWRFAAFTGVRRGELVGLRWRDLDLDAARAFIVQQRAKGGGMVKAGGLKGKRTRDGPRARHLFIHWLPRRRKEPEARTGYRPDSVRLPSPPARSGPKVSDADERGGTQP